MNHPWTLLNSLIYVSFIRFWKFLAIIFSRIALTYSPSSFWTPVTCILTFWAWFICSLCSPSPYFSSVCIGLYIFFWLPSFIMSSAIHSLLLGQPRKLLSLDATFFSSRILTCFFKLIPILCWNSPSFHLVYLSVFFKMLCCCSVAQSCLTLCNPMDYNTPGFPVLHYLPELMSISQCPLSQWCHSTVLSSVAPFYSCPQSFPASEAFPMGRLFASGGQSIGAST